MLCAISGDAPQVPVASRKSGNVYEKRLIETYIRENGIEPATGEALTVEDLVDLKAPRSVRPRPPSLTSIPSLLGVFQEEWDSLALEAYTLRQNLAQTRQELSTALYQHDAAVRVVARLTRERDEAREALAKVDVGRKSAAATNGDAMQVDQATLPAPIVAKVETTQEKFSKTRRKRPVPEDWATSDSIASFGPKSTNNQLDLGGAALAIHQGGDLTLVGGADGTVGVYSTKRNAVLQSVHGGAGAITGALWAGDKPVLSTASGKVKVFSSNFENEIASFSAHAGSTTAIALHPSGDILASVGEDHSYVLYDLETMKVLTQISSNSSLTCAKFHPDGHLLAAGAMDGQIKVFDVRLGTEAAVFDVGAPLKQIFFSENGIWFAAVTQKSSLISIWDIRKTAEIKSIDLGGQIDSIDWDYTGQFIAAGGPGGISVSQYSKVSKEWTEPLKSATPAKSVTWGLAANSILALGEDGAITVLGE